MIGFRHVVECTCILPQFANKQNPPFHKFIVFSIEDDQGNIVQKHVQCDNCGIVHRVTELGKSTILKGKEELKTMLTLNDIKSSLPEKLVSMLSLYELGQSTWEQAKFVLENEKWGTTILLSSDVVDGRRSSKFMRMLGRDMYAIDSFEAAELVEDS